MVTVTLKEPLSDRTGGFTSGSGGDFDIRSANESATIPANGTIHADQSYDDITAPDFHLPEPDDWELGTEELELESFSQQDRFRELAEQWRNASAHMSSVTDIVMLPSYQQIIGMGRFAIPLILRELEQRPEHWFWALKAITGEDPVSPASRGRIRDMADAWIEWGRQHGIDW